ncbi:hypothetical protein DSECCO2_426440 [anaerobic digester metagenome]
MTPLMIVSDWAAPRAVVTVMGRTLAGTYMTAAASRKAQARAMLLGLRACRAAPQRGQRP